MKTVMTMLVALSFSFADAQLNEEYKAAVQTLNQELQSNTQDNDFQRDINYQVTLNSKRQLTITHTWRQNNGKQEQIVLQFHPRDIVDINSKYNSSSDALALAIQCQENTVANYWTNGTHLNNSVDLNCLTNNRAAVQRIQDTLLYLKTLANR